MPRSIVLSVGAKTHTLTLDSQRDGKAIFTEKTGPLLGRLRLTAKIAPNGANTVLRDGLKLEKAKVHPGTDGALPTVQYVQVWSHDISIVIASDEAEREGLYNLNAALLANEHVRAMIVSGVQLDA